MYTQMMVITNFITQRGRQNCTTSNAHALRQMQISNRMKWNGGKRVIIDF